MAEQCARKSNDNSEPNGDDIEPVGESRADVEMGNDEDEEPLEAEIPRARMNPKNPSRIILNCVNEPSTKALQDAVIFSMCGSGSDS